MGLNETFKGNNDYLNLPRRRKISVTSCHKDYGQGDIDDLALEPATKEIDGERAEGFDICIDGDLSRNEP